ncbi:MAG: FxLYD domain-containing protein [Candidatus Hydrothermarchaeales archaeon]
MEETLLQGPGGEFWIGGKIRNNDDAEALYVQASLTLFDKYGKVLDSRKSVPIDRIDPGETVEINVIKSDILKVNVARYNLSVQREG